MAVRPARAVAEVAPTVVPLAPRHGTGTGGVRISDGPARPVAVPVAPEPAPAVTERVVHVVPEPPVPAPEPAVDVEPTAAAEAEVVVDAPERAPRERKPRARRERKAEQPGEAQSVWDMFDLPTAEAPRVRRSTQALLAGKAREVTVYLPPQVHRAIQAVMYRAAVRGERVTARTIAAHALAFAYRHPDEWLGIVPADGRSRESDGLAVTATGVKTTFGMTDGLREQTDGLLWRAGESGRSPARATLVSVAVAWALSRAGEWEQEAVQQPVVVEPRTRR